MAAQSIVAKFSVAKVEVYGPTSRLVVLKPVYSQDPEHENKVFWGATPSGELSMTINSQRAGEFFVPGQEYYIAPAREGFVRLVGAPANV